MMPTSTRAVQKIDCRTPQAKPPKEAYAAHSCGVGVDPSYGSSPLNRKGILLISCSYQGIGAMLGTSTSWSTESWPLAALPGSHCQRHGVGGRDRPGRLLKTLPRAPLLKHLRRPHHPPRRVQSPDNKQLATLKRRHRMQEPPRRHRWSIAPSAIGSHDLGRVSAAANECMYPADEEQSCVDQSANCKRRARRCHRRERRERASLSASMRTRDLGERVPPSCVLWTAGPSRHFGRFARRTSFVRSFTGSGYTVLLAGQLSTFAGTGDVLVCGRTEAPSSLT